MVINIVFLIVSLLYAIIIDVNTALLLLITYLIGSTIVNFFLKGKLIKPLLKLYQISFLTSSIYMLMSYLYMEFNNYDYLLAFDTIKYFIPVTKEYLSNGNYFNVLISVWENYNFLDRRMTGYFTLLTAFGRFSELLDANFYIALQLASLFFSSFISVVLFKLFRINKFTKKESFKYSLVISLFTVLFVYSTQILRDIHIALLFLTAIYLTFKKDFSLLNLLKIVTVCLITFVFRVEFGVFLLIMIPTYLLLTLQQNKQKLIVLGVTFLISAVMVIFIMLNYSTIEVLFINNREHFDEGITEGTGAIAFFQTYPIVGDFISIIYNFIQPLPFWSRWFVPDSWIRPELFNIMTFPSSFGAFFNWVTLVLIITWLFTKKIRKRVSRHISKPLKYHLIIGVFFLFIQSAVMTQRRLMAYYCIFYILTFIIYKNLNKREIKGLLNLAIITFIGVNLIIGIYLVKL